MLLVDIVFIIIIIGFLLFGLWFGLVHAIGSNIGFFLGIFIASRTYDLFGGGAIMKIIVFILIFSIVGRLIGLIFLIINKMFNIIKIIPFTKTIDKLLGALFGFTEGVLIVTGVVFIVSTQHIPWFTEYVSQSHIAPFALKCSKILIPFLSKALIKITGLF